MKRLVRKHPLAIRWFHWINFPLLAIMIWSGTLIYWANPVYIPLPKPVWQTLHIGYRLAEGMAFHFFFMWLFGINGLLYVIYTILSGEWRLLVPDRKSFKEAWFVLLHDLHLRREPPPQKKYNAAQKISYTLIVVMGGLSLLSGLAIYKPVQLGWLRWLLGGYSSARFIHFWLTVGYCVFFVVHSGQVIKTGWNNFRAMVIGREVVNE